MRIPSITASVKNCSALLSAEVTAFAEEDKRVIGGLRDAGRTIARHVAYAITPKHLRTGIALPVHAEATWPLLPHLKHVTARC